MTDLTCYSLTASEHKSLEDLIDHVGIDLTLEQMWHLMDQAWKECGCDNRHPDLERYARFYSHPVWLLNGMFVEQHDVSMGHRHAITASVAGLHPDRVVDFGGGFGTLARLLAEALPEGEVHVCEPYPPRHGIASCNAYTNIHFVPQLREAHYDALVSTDVLEHVPDPLALLAEMINAVRPGGHLFIANCFFQVIQCHLPCTFHLRYNFNSFCRELGLEVVGPSHGSHATIYRRSQVLEPNWSRLRALEHRSQRLFQWRQWRSRHISPWGHRARLLTTDPLHYPRKLMAVVRSAR